MLFHREGINQKFSRNLDSLAPIKGRWRKKYFENRNPLILELGCGRGEYALALAELFPDLNLLGIDKDYEKIWQGARLAFENNLRNSAFLNIYAQQLPKFFDSSEVDEIWITFPDIIPLEEGPLISLVSEDLVNIYKDILKIQGSIHLKTEDPFVIHVAEHNFHEAGFTPLKLVEDIHSQNPDPILQIITGHEQNCIEQGKPIHYLECAY